MLVRSRGPVSIAVTAVVILVIVWWPQLMRITPALSIGAGEARFISRAMEEEYAGAINFSRVREVCSLTKWRQDLLFECEHIHGGIGNVRNHLLNCIRYSIAGGGALVMPEIGERSAEDIFDIYVPEREPIEYLFNRMIFVRRLAQACPQLRLFDSAKLFYQNILALPKPMDLEPGLLDADARNYSHIGLGHPDNWRHSFDNWLSDNRKDDGPVHVRLGRSYLEYPVYSDGALFVDNFGKILSFRPEVLNLAAKVLLELRRRFALPIHPDRLINPNAYFGAHLRVEHDAMMAFPTAWYGLATYESQAAPQIAKLRETKLNVLYIASGNRTLATKFGAEAQESLRQVPRPGRHSDEVAVVMKEDLLFGKDLDQMHSMTFDQQGMIDFIIMLKCSRFAGVGHSSFAWNVAMRRHQLSAKAKNETADQDFTTFDDEFSTILGYENGRAMNEYRKTLWP